MNLNNFDEWKRFMRASRHSKPELVAAVRLDDGSLVIGMAPAGLEVRAFGADDLDERGMPRWKP